MINKFITLKKFLGDMIDEISNNYCFLYNKKFYSKQIICQSINYSITEISIKLKVIENNKVWKNKLQCLISYIN